MFIVSTKFLRLAPGFPINLGMTIGLLKMI